MLLEQSWPEAQVVPQAPQFARSEVRSLHTPEQAVWPEGQPQVPETQEVPPVHLVPQVPQLRESDLTSTQDPLHSV